MERDNSKLNTKRKKLSRKQKEDICERLTERMGRARDVYSQYRVELRSVLKDLGKVCVLPTICRGVSRRVAACCCVSHVQAPCWRRADFLTGVCAFLFLLVLGGAWKLGEERARTPQTDPNPEQGRRQHSTTHRRRTSGALLESARSGSCLCSHARYDSSSMFHWLNCDSNTKGARGLREERQEHLESVRTDRRGQESATEVE